MGGKDFYTILGVAKGATEEEIKKGYRKAAVKWHPDKHSGKSESERAAAEEKFKDIARVYEVLSDSNQREVYDTYGEEGLKAGGGGGPFGMPGGFPANGFPTGGMPGGFPSGAFTSGGGPGGVQFVFTSNGSGMNSGRADDIFQSFFAGGDPFAGFGFGDDDFLSSRMHKRPRGGPSASSRAERADVLPKQAVVKLVGLSTESLNGNVGTVESFDTSNQRYTVRLPGNEAVAVKPANVRQVINDARVEGTSQEALNGSLAASAVFDSNSKRYVVEGVAANPISLKPENLVLPPSTRVNIAGVSSRPQLNGKAGKIVGAGGHDRYTVQLADSGEQIRLKFSNVVALHGLAGG